MKYSSEKKIDGLVRKLVKAGWLFTRGGKHGRLQPPSGHALTVPCSPSDRRAYLNFRRDVRSAFLPGCAIAAVEKDG